MSDQDDFVTIRPRQVALSHRESDDAAAPAPPTRVSSPNWVFAGLGVLLLFGLWVFVFLPDQVSTPDPRPSSGPQSPPAATAAQPAAPATATGDPTPPPYQQLQVERERKRAQQTLSGFVELQIKLEEDMHVDQWGNDEFRAAQALANEGDELFADEAFDEAIARYQSGSGALEALVAQGSELFESALEEGRLALANMDGDAAIVAFQRAALVYPDHPEVTGGLARASQVPEILDRLATARELRADGDIEAARAIYQGIRQLDPATPGIDEALAELDAMVAEIRFQTLISDGYAALNEARYAAARRSFNAALSARPGNPAALAGLEQVGQASTLSRIDRLRANAERQEGQEQWAQASESYQEVLAIEGTLKFARDGRARSAARARLDTQLSEAIAKPELLSSDERFEAAVALYQRGTRTSPAGPKLEDQLNELEGILETAAQPVAVTLVSDNATEITVFQVGFLGVFERKQLNLRPGRYVIRGSRNGCRDVRMEVDVAPDMAPLDVRCLERL